MSISTLPLFPDLELLGPPPVLAPRRAAPRKRWASRLPDQRIMLELQPARPVPKPEASPASSDRSLETARITEEPVVAAEALEAVGEDPAPPARPEPLTDRGDVTLADVIEFVRRDPSITATQRSDRLCAVRRLADVLNRDPRLVSAVPDALRADLKAIVPAAIGLTDRRFETIRSRTLTAMRQAGIAVMRGRSSTVLSTAWQQFEQTLSDQRAKAGLSRFMRF